jgi:AraC family transcriptional activator of tynA and feaB
VPQRLLDGRWIAMAAYDLARSFSTASLAPLEGARRWQDYMAAAYNDLDITPAHSWHSGTIREIMVGSIGVSCVAVGAQKVVRRRGVVPAGEEDYLIVIPVQGALSVRQGRHANTIEPGDACILNAADHYEGWMPDASSNVALKLPAHLLRARLGPLEDVCGRAHVADPEMIPIVRRFAADLFSITTTKTVGRLEDACLDLLSVMLDGEHSGGATHASTTSDRLARDLQGFIKRHLGDPALAISAVAAALGVSTRLIQKVLQHAGTTFGEMLMAARLERAGQLLQDRARSGLSVGQIAFACGFVSQAHFSARFRQKFGASPSTVRRVNALSTDRHQEAGGLSPTS